MKNQPLRHTFSKMRTTLSFNFVVLRKKAKKSLQRIKTHVQDRTLVLFITPVVLCRCCCCRCRGFALYYKLPNNTSIQRLYHTIQFLRVFSLALLYMYREFFMNQCVIDVVIHCIRKKRGMKTLFIQKTVVILSMYNNVVWDSLHSLSFVFIALSKFIQSFSVSN